MYDSDIKKLLRVLRSRWWLILASVVVFAGGAAVYASTRETQYTADTQLFVSAAGTANASPAEVYDRGLASQALAASYTTLISNTPVANAVIKRLDLPESVQDVQSKITATTSTDSPLINVTVADTSAQRATDIAKALGAEFPRYVATLAAPRSNADPSSAPVQVRVTSPPELPTSASSPSEGRYVAGGAVLGFAIGIGGAVMLALLDRRVRDDDAGGEISGAPVLARIPRDSRAKQRPLVSSADPESPEAEAYRRLRTNLQGAMIDRGGRSLLVTSAVAGEGKTFVSTKLALAFAHAGHRVVLVDADMRRGGIDRLLEVQSTPGLSELLADSVADAGALDGHLDDVLYREEQFPLEVLTSGPPPPNPNELLESNAFGAVLAALTRRAEIVIVDSPALLPFGDAAVIARLASAVLMVARVSTRSRRLDLAVESLRTVGAEPVGAVLNAVRRITGPSYVHGRRGGTAPRPGGVPADQPGRDPSSSSSRA
jgi:receptor protein-tyrosine kinase